MTIIANLFKDKKPCLEEGQTIHTVPDNGYSVADAERCSIVGFFRKLVRIFLQILLLACILLFVWILFEFASRAIDPTLNRPICGSGSVPDHYEAFGGDCYSAETLTDEANEFPIVETFKDPADIPESLSHQEAVKFVNSIFQRPDNATRIQNSPILEA